MANCSECLNSRLVMSENGWHPVCTLLEKETHECLIDGSKFLPNELYLKCGGEKNG